MAMLCLELITKATDSPQVLDVTSRGSTILLTTAVNILSQSVVSHRTLVVKNHESGRMELISL